MLLILFVALAQSWSVVEPDVAPFRTTGPLAKIDNHDHACMWEVDYNLYVLRDYIWKYEIYQKRWLWLDPTPFPVSSGSCWTLHRKLWYYSDQGMWSYDIASRRWDHYSGGGGPGIRYQAVYWTHEYSNRLYLYGGTNNVTEYGDMWTFDVLTHKWELAVSTGNPATSLSNVQATLGPDGNRVYLYLKDRMWCLFLSTMVWQEMGASGPPGPHRVSFVLFQNIGTPQLVLYGGQTGSKIFSDTWIYDTSKDTWTQQQPGMSPGQRYAMATTKTFVAGGLDGTHNDIWIYGNIPAMENPILNQLDLPATIVAAVCSVLSLFLLLLICIVACIQTIRRKRMARPLMQQHPSDITNDAF